MSIYYFILGGIIIMKEKFNVKGFAVRNTYLSCKYLNGEICNYDWTIMVSEEEDKEDNIEEI